MDATLTKPNHRAIAIAWCIAVGMTLTGISRVYPELPVGVGSLFGWNIDIDQVSQAFMPGVTLLFLLGMFMTIVLTDVREDSEGAMTAPERASVAAIWLGVIAALGIVLIPINAPKIPHDLGRYASIIEEAAPNSPVAARIRAGLKTPASWRADAPWLSDMSYLLDPVKSDAVLGIDAIERVTVAAIAKDDPRVQRILADVIETAVLTRQQRVELAAAIVHSPAAASAGVNPAALIARLQP